MTAITLSLTCWIEASMVTEAGIRLVLGLRNVSSKGHVNTYMSSVFNVRISFMPIRILGSPLQSMYVTQSAARESYSCGHFIKDAITPRVTGAATPPPHRSFE